MSTHLLSLVLFHVQFCVRFFRNQLLNTIRRVCISSHVTWTSTRKAEGKISTPRTIGLKHALGTGGKKRKERPFDSERQSEGEICITLALICATLCSHAVPANPLATWRGWMGICRTFPYAHACKANSTLISCGTLYRLWELMGLN